MATTTTLIWSDLPPSEASDVLAPTISLAPTSSSTSSNSPSIKTLASSSKAVASPSASSKMLETNCPSFPKFSSLPREIQFSIWSYSITSVGASEKYEPYQILIPAWKYFSTQPWHKGLSCCVPKQKVLRDMLGRSRRTGVGNVGLHALIEKGGMSPLAADEVQGLQFTQREQEVEMVKRSAHPHIHAGRCGKTIYLSPGWARSGLGGIANSCLTGRWLVLEYMKNGLQAFESGCLEVEKQHVLVVLEEVVEEMDGRLRGWCNRREETLISL